MEVVAYFSWRIRLGYGWAFQAAFGTQDSDDDTPILHKQIIHGRDWGKGEAILYITFDLHICKFQKTCFHSHSIY